MKNCLPVLCILCLLLAAATAGCSSPPSHPATANQVPAGAGTTTAAGTPGTWISDAPAGTPGAALLGSAKILMKNIYSYDPESPDYLPGSYTAQKKGQTAYVIHAAKDTQVLWPANGTTQVAWKSEPEGLPAGWSGTTVTAGNAGTVAADSPAIVKTDCSGFITSLFTYAGTKTPTKFTGWKAGSPIPEAGCFAPAGSCSTPNPLNYYNLFATGKNGWFRKVPLDQLLPGDILAYANTKNQNDSGHIMLVAAVGAADSSGSRNIVVIDETGSPHGSDTRQEKSAGPGIGMGIIRLSPGGNGTARFFWSPQNPSAQDGPVLPGRAL